MLSKILIIIPAAVLVTAVPQVASSAPSLGGGTLTAAAERLSPVENVHYYGYRGGYGGGYYGGGYGRGYYGGYGRGYYGGGYGGYGRGYYGGGYGGYGRGYY